MFSHNPHNLSDSEEINKSILNHLFLPYDLPSSASNDYLIQHDNQNEYKLLDCMNEYLKSLDAHNTLSIFSILKICLQNWLGIQNPTTCSIPVLQSTIGKLTPGDFLPLYFHKQNAAILIEINENPPHQPLISSWQVLLPTETITSSFESHCSCFPIPTFRLPDHSQLLSRVQCELLHEFMHNTIEHLKSMKSSRLFDETHEVPISHYVCQWWITQFRGIEIVNQRDSEVKFTKKHRDRIRCGHSSLFRRSGLWMTIKVVFHTILTKRLGEIGTIIYKLLITDFLAHFIRKRHASMDIDLVVFCLRKIVRRMDKIDKLCLSSLPKDLNNMQTWIVSIKKQIKLKIDKVTPDSDWQKSMRDYEARNKISKALLNSCQTKICHHSFTKLKTYLDSAELARSNDSQFICCSNTNHSMSTNFTCTDSALPSIPSVTYRENDNIGIVLIHIEIWVESFLDKWIHQSFLSKNTEQCFEHLQTFFENYQRSALNYYYYSENKSTDSIGYSRYIMTSLTIIHSIHKHLCEDPRFNRLKLHSIQIPNLFTLFEFLVLPNHDDMIRARVLYDYFQQFNSKPFPDLLNDITSQDAFGVYFADQSETMKYVLQQIQEEAKTDETNKRNEVSSAKQKYEQLMANVDTLECKCLFDGSLRIKCEKCETRQEAMSMKERIYERPIPCKHESALAVVFELQMPKEIRCYRDILWQFINRPNPTPPLNMHEWLSVSPHKDKLRAFDNCTHNCKVKLVSSTKSISESHYSAPRAVSSTPIEEFVFKNSLRVEISPTQPTQFEDERRTLTPQLNDSNYKHLQYTVDTTDFVQNRVIAELSHCSLQIKPTEFVEFGSFRSGHRLQWWNLLSMLELDSLSMDEESVAILISHSLWQYGPLTTDVHTFISSWCPESHQPILDDAFVDEFISRLNHRLKDCETNWQNEFVLVILTVIIMRIFTLCNLTRKQQTFELVLKCRSVGEKWIELISKVIQNPSSIAVKETDDLRDKIITIGISSLQTFSIYTEKNTDRKLSNHDVISLLKLTTTISDNLILTKTQTDTNIYMRNLMRYTSRILIMLHPTLNEFLKTTSYQTLHEFAVLYWAAIPAGEKSEGKWNKQNTDNYDGCYDGTYGSTQVSIDCLKGTFLVNNMTVGFLPLIITSNSLFKRVFGNHIFEVQATELQGTFITKYGYHIDGQIHYLFNYNNNTERLTIQELHKNSNDVFELIPSDCFQTELPDICVSNYSHWRNKEKQQMEFRPIHFQNPNFSINKDYILDTNTGVITTANIENPQVLIDRSSAFFQSLFKQYFIRLDDEPYVYMLNDTSTSIIHIHLSRLGIAFEYHTHTNKIISREYSDMHVDEDQWFGTLTGLTSGLLLSPMAVIDKTQKYYLSRKLIVPFGQVQVTNSTNNEHQTVTIERKLSSTTESTVHQYFVFILNDRLRILQSTDSPTGWLYLALLHAMTSHPLPDKYTGMTGMERSFQLLNSAGCWSDQPFDHISLNVLLQIASISPKVSYYPEHLTCTEKVDWNNTNLPYSMQHFGYYLVAKTIFEESEQLNFMYSSSTSKEIKTFFENQTNNQNLLAKLYWFYRDSYNPLARLSVEMEVEIQSKNSTDQYKPIWINSAKPTTYSPLSLVENLYSDGDIDLKESSQLSCFPLSRWLSSEYQLKHVWIGLFDFIEEIKQDQSESKLDRIEQFDLLLNFLHYISDKCSMQPYYLQLLRSILKSPLLKLRSLDYPSFERYKSIEQTTFREDYIIFSERLYQRNHARALREIRRCFQTNTMYTDEAFDGRYISKRKINRLFELWRENEELRLFINNIQKHINSVTLVLLHHTISIICQEFTIKSFEDHHQIKIASFDFSLDKKLLENAERKFHHPHFDYFIKPTTSNLIINQEKILPDHILPSTDSQLNPLSKIAHHFKEHLTESWKKFQSNEDYQHKYPSETSINEFLKSVRQQSKQLWNQLEKSITSNNDLLFKTGLALRILPTTLISLIQQLDKSNASLVLTTEQRTLLGGIMVNWIVEQQIVRALHFANKKKWEDFDKEISNIPHVNWIPSEHIPWLILQLEMNITIRKIQIEVTRHMIQPNLVGDNSSTIRNVVMQLNMGEGKTSVILPMLALSLSSSSSRLVRIIVLKALFPMNYQSLRYKLGGLLNRRVLPFACRRDMNFRYEQMLQISNRLQCGLNNCDVVLTSPEDILSFDLLTIDKCRRNEFDTGSMMLSVQRWLKQYIRDVLDESDEILHVKYQLIYSIGRQQQIDGGVERWKTIQFVLNLVKQNAENIAQMCTDDVFYKASEQNSRFPEFRLLTHKPFEELHRRIAKDWLDKKNYRQIQQQLILKFLLDSSSSIDDIIGQFPETEIQLFLILRGLLAAEVLFVSLKKRYRVNFGINQNAKFNRLMAVPFRAKDVAAENTEFGHPDVAIVLTQLSYFYAGLNDSQLLQCFHRLNQDESDPELIYDEWISLENENPSIPIIRQWKSINLKDHHQRTQQLFPSLRHNMLVINYFLNHFVFPREAKQFPNKLVASAWDLSSSSRTNITTGFSGTNDTQLLLPIHIRQSDLPDLKKTDAIVLNNLFRPENENYQNLSINTNSDEILQQIINHKSMIQVILDVGALFVDGDNRQIAVKWLNLSDKTKIDYAVYFESNSIFVYDRQYHSYAFSTSPASGRLDRCVFYLDEIHTRGTDFKFPDGFRAAVTLGNGLTKDRLVQACMRMRKLGKHHWLSFWSSNEVHQQIQLLKKQDNVNNRITLTDILRWVYENTQHATWDGLHHWATQSLSFQRKVAAFQDIEWTNDQQEFSNSIMENLGQNSLEQEVLELQSMYGLSKSLQTILDIYSARCQYLNILLSNEIRQAVSERLHAYGGTKKLLSQLLDEEQQRELEQELEEERQQKRPCAVVPYEPILHDEIKRLCDMQTPKLDLSRFNSVFYPIADAFLNTSFYNECQPRCWQSNFWVSSEFKRVIQTQGELFDPFLRPARWILVYHNQHLIFLSPYEANFLFGQLNLFYRTMKCNEPWTTTLRLLLPRTKSNQSILVNTSTLIIPRSTEYFTIPIEWLIELYIFNGTLYFQTADEQIAYCQCLGLCPKPRTELEEDAFEKGYISIDGFVENEKHRRHLQLNRCRFKSNPLIFIRKIVENRNHVYAPLKSHVGSIIMNACKLGISRKRRLFDQDLTTSRDDSYGSSRKKVREMEAGSKQKFHRIGTVGDHELSDTEQKMEQ